MIWAKADMSATCAARGERGMTMDETYNVQNVSEALVEMYLDQCIADTGMCGCARCRADVKAYALNNFRPFYVVTDFGDVMTRTQALSIQFYADILTAIMKGVVIVRDNPRH